MGEQGLEVRQIDPHSPVLRMRSITDPNLRGIMDVGDVIIAVDGQPVSSLADYYGLLDASVERGGSVILTVVDVRNSQPAEWQVLGQRVQVAASGAAADSPPPQTLRRAHFLLIGDTLDTGVGVGEQTNLDAWKALAMSIQASRRGTMTVLSGANCQPGKILATIGALNIPSRDTVFCFYGGHGAYDPNLAEGHRSRGHYFAIRDAQQQLHILMRRQVTNALESKGARLTVLMTDTCNVLQTLFPPEEVVSELRSLNVMGLTPFEQLLFDYQGIVDISGTNFGEYGFCEPGIGGWFSYRALPILATESDWRNAYDRMRISTDNFYRQRKSYWETPPRTITDDMAQIFSQQHTLTPTDILLAVRREPASTRGPVATAPRIVTYEVRKSVEMVAAPAAPE